MADELSVSLTEILGVGRACRVHRRNTVKHKL